MHSASEALQIAKELVRSGMSVQDANIEVIRMMGVRIIAGSIPSDIRKHLSSGVKAGKLGHLRKDGLRPEAYFHPNSRAKAIEKRNRIANESIDALRRVFVPASDL